MNGKDKLAVGEQPLFQCKVLEVGENAILICDLEGSIIWVNPAFSLLTGYRFGEVVGKNPRILKSGLQTQAFYGELWTRILSGKVWHGELTNRRKDGSLYMESMTITPVQIREGTLTHFIAIKQDITERTQASAILMREKSLLR